MLNISRRDFMKGIMIGGVAAGSAGLLAACGSSSSSSESSTSSSSTDTTDSTTEESTAAAEDQYIVVTEGTAYVWDSLTPVRSNTYQDAPWARLMYEHLITYDADNNAVPWVVKSWESDDGGFTYHCELYDGVTDTEGNSFTAEDAVWLMQLNMSEGLRPIFTKIDSVTQTGDLTFDIVLKSNNVNTVEDAMYCCLVVTKAAYEASSDGMANQPVTTSRYVVSDHVSGSEFKLTLRDDYWMDESEWPYFVKFTADEINFKIISEASQLGIALETGEVDVAYNLAAATASQYIGLDGYTSVIAKNLNGTQIFFSGGENRVVTNDVYLRQAICYAVDVDGLINTVALGYGNKMYDSASSAAIGWMSSWTEEEYYEYDVDKAMELLEMSDYQGETLTLLTGSGNQRLAEMLQSYLEAVGINLELNLADSALLTSIRLDGTQWDLFVNTVGGTTLADHWSTRYDPNGYTAGDAASRKDYTLGELIDTASTIDGFTEENIQAVHEYIRDNMYGYGMYEANNIILYRDDLGVTEESLDALGRLEIALTTYGNYGK